jgi:hypothetical protein
MTNHVCWYLQGYHSRVTNTMAKRKIRGFYRQLFGMILDTLLVA